MLERKRPLCFFIFALFLLTGCAGPSQKTPVGIGETPEWVVRPQVDQGIAATGCVPDSDNYSSDRKKVVSQARQSLAQQLQTRVKAMDKAYQQRGIAETKSAGGSIFASVSKQPTRQILKKAVQNKIAYEKVNRQKHLCVMLSLGGKEMKDFFNRLVELSDTDLSPRDEEILYQVFTDGQAQGEQE